MTVGEVMTTPVAVCRTQTTLADATALMWDHDCGVLPVVNDLGELSGMVTDRDICIALGTRNARAADLLVSDVIGNHTLFCSSSDDVVLALKTMRAGRMRRLPVVDHRIGKLEGILSMDDLVLKAIDGRSESVMATDLADTLKVIYAHADEPTVHAATA